MPGRAHGSGWQVAWLTAAARAARPVPALFIAPSPILFCRETIGFP